MGEIREMVSAREQTMQREVDRLIRLTEDSEKDRKRAIEEIKNLRSEFQRQKEREADTEWEQISRRFHWNNSLEQLKNLSPDRPNIKLKTILDTSNYYGDNQPYLRDYTLMNRASNSESVVDVATGRLHGRPAFQELKSNSLLQLNK